MSGYSDFSELGQKQGLVQYESDFYSGSQVQVMIGEVLIDNAVSIQYQVQQSKTPVFGYASQYFRFIADGPVLVTGSLTIAFKEAGYLLYTLQHFQDTNGGDVRYLGKDHSWSAKSGEYESLSAAMAASKKGRVRYENIEQILKKGEKSGPNYATLVKQLHALSDKEFEDMAEDFEDVIWYGSGRQSPFTRANLFSRNLPDGVISNEEVYSHRRLDQYPSCDIWITYGDMEAPDGVNHTVYKLLDVHFTGESQVVSASGEPVYETYNFFARNRV